MFGHIYMRNINDTKNKLKRYLPCSSYRPKILVQRCYSAIREA